MNPRTDGRLLFFVIFRAVPHDLTFKNLPGQVGSGRYELNLGKIAGHLAHLLVVVWGACDYCSFVMRAPSANEIHIRITCRRKLGLTSEGDFSRQGLHRIMVRWPPGWLSIRNKPEQLDLRWNWPSLASKTLYSVELFPCEENISTFDARWPRKSFNAEIRWNLYRKRYYTNLYTRTFIVPFIAARY